MTYSLGSLSGSEFCKRFMPPEKRNSKDAYQGPKFFTYKGETLIDLRAKLNSKGSKLIDTVEWHSSAANQSQRRGL